MFKYNKHTPLDQDHIKYLFDLDFVTGILVWKNPTSLKIFKGAIAGCLRKDNYRVIGIYGKLYLAHRIIYLYINGQWPENLIDHKTCDPANNKPNLIRDATKSQNGMNRGLQSNNTSGYRGISWDKNYNKWHAYIKINGKRIHLGYFELLQNAVEAREIAEQKYFGDFNYKQAA